MLENVHIILANKTQGQLCLKLALQNKISLKTNSKIIYSITREF